MQIFEISVQNLIQNFSTSLRNKKVSEKLKKKKLNRESFMCG